MAAPTLSKVEWSRVFVQEISQKGEQIPERYLQKDGFPEAIDAPELWADTLLIDFSLLSSSSPATRAELAKLRSALSDWGCFQVINHGIENSLLQEVIEVSKQFFALPMEDKLKLSPRGDPAIGYGNDSHVAGGTLTWHDCLHLKIYPEESRKHHFWPQKPDKFRKILQEYSEKIAVIIQTIFKSAARSLNLDEDCFLNMIGKPAGELVAGINLCPRCPCPQRVLAFKPHSDPSATTIVLPESGGESLQVEKDDQWFKVSVIPGALFFNCGDIAEVISNGVFKAVKHRVVPNSIKDRVSVAVLCISAANNEIEPVRSLIRASRPQKYRKYSNWHDFIQAFLEKQRSRP